MKEYYVYIMANKRPTLYVGMTNDLLARVHQHKTGQVDGFTKRYGLNKLVYYETTPDVRVAISREKRLKHWDREWKLSLVRRSNPELIDLYPQLAGADDSPVKPENDRNRLGAGLV